MLIVRKSLLFGKWEYAFSSVAQALVRLSIFTKYSAGHVIVFAVDKNAEVIVIERSGRHLVKCLSSHVFLLLLFLPFFHCVHNLCFFAFIV